MSASLLYNMALAQLVKEAYGSQPQSGRDWWAGGQEPLFDGGWGASKPKPLGPAPDPSRPVPGQQAPATRGTLAGPVRANFSPGLPSLPKADGIAD